MKEYDREYLKEQYDGLRGGRDACGVGLIVNIDGRKEHRTVSDALGIVEKLDHRAGRDASGEVGDGVGILIQISHSFFKKAAAEAGITVGGEGEYGVGMFFMPRDTRKRTLSERLFAVICEKNGLKLLGWRDVPTKPEILGKRALDAMPRIMQCFVGKPDGCEKGAAFDRRLYVCRREFEQSTDDVYVNSLSSRTVVYKGMFLVGQLRAFYPDLEDEDCKSAIAVVHSRFSTNTTPSWERAHPYRLIAHNGEINTIRGNYDRMLAREETLYSPELEEDAEKIFPVIHKTGSDSAMLDNTLEFFMMNGIPLPLAVMMTIPEPWRNDPYMDKSKADFYHYYATMMEPWDGPAAILFTDGVTAGATLDRNGLRPARYCVTDDGRLILASETGAIDVPPEHIVKKSRLSPGRMLLVDTEKKRIISDSECKELYACEHPYGEWLSLNLLHLSELTIPNKKIPVNTQDMRDRLYKVFGYTYEDVKSEILPMAENGAEATASMGTDIPLAVLSEKHQPLFSYFKQVFAQVTNPPIDSVREEIVTDTAVYIGSDGNLLKASGENCRVLQINNPILTGVDLLKIKALDRDGLRSGVVSILYYKNTPLEKAIERLLVAVDGICRKGVNIVILSDRGVDENHVPIPSLLAVSAVEQHLVETRKRTAVSLIIESGEPRDVHQVAALLGFGARAINPYLAHECIVELIDLKILDKDYHTAIDDYNSALLHGIVKTAAKMGISTLQSYQSAKIFEAVGLAGDVIDKYFTGTVSRVGGIGINEISEGVLYRHDRAFDPMGLAVDTTLDSTGFHSLRSGVDKEDHMYSPQTIVTLQRAAREGSYDLFREYTALVDSDTPHTLRGLLDFRTAENSVPLEEVESAAEIVKRFKTGAMSYGSISKAAHETLAVAMNRLGARSNTGEGGEDPLRFGTEKNSKIKQVASGRFGVTSEYLGNAEEIQIKMAQGAKPGEGGHLPGKKVYPWIAERRYSTPGVALISPPPHHDIYSIEDLAQLIYDLKNANRQARISVKLVSEAGVGTIACGVAKAGAQVILISGYDGGTGAAPQSSIHNAGLPWELGLAETQRSLVENGLRERVVIETDGKLMSGRDVVTAALLGAEEFGFATAPLVCMGCMMMRACNRDTCPVGIACQNELLRKRFAGKPEHVMNFMLFVAEEVREIMAKLGFRRFSDMVGRSDLLKVKDRQITRRAETVDMSGIIESPYSLVETRRFNAEKVYDFRLENTVDERVLIPEFERWNGKGVLRIGGVNLASADRTTGTMLGSEITKKFGSSLPEDSVVVEMKGGAGQSFGAFIPSGLTLKLEGDANDGFGKGLSGGKLIVTPPRGAKYDAAENIIVGNVALYGATAGKAYINGIAGERFMVRNSGAVAVCEGCGDHGLEYMTGGKAVILGEVGKNFAAGMSGGVAYILDESHSLYMKTNTSLIEIDELTDEADREELKAILADYEKCTGSKKAARILGDFDGYIPSFKRIISIEYKRMLALISANTARGMDRERAVYEAFTQATAG
ncbi:MAG: glutamate synthase large subunit [Clostridiales bacterium]|nr:glutamate synthase large subunit [Clostridiales bacterium]